MSTTPMSVLLIEDEDDHFEMIHRGLHRASAGAIQLDRADRLSTALDRLNHRQYSVILLDLCLPDSRGVDTCRRVSGASNDTPVIVLSSLTLDQDEIDREFSGLATDCLSKSQLDGNRLLDALTTARSRWTTPDVKPLQDADSADPPVIPGFQIQGQSMTASTVKADFYDWLQLPGGDTLVAIGNASGCGLAAEIMATHTKASVRKTAERFENTASILSNVNRQLVDFGSADYLMTQALFRIDAAESTVRYCSAGHTAALMFNKDGWVTDRFCSTGMPLGMLNEPGFQESPAIPMNPGDTLVLLTDGLVQCESRGRDEFGEQQLIDAIGGCVRRGHGTLVDNILQSALRHRGDLPLTDDMTAVVIRRETKSSNQDPMLFPLSLNKATS
jgi:serine phosphatase RsbU (regulator of sigma subunit)